MVKLLISRSIRVYSAHGIGMRHIEGMTKVQWCLLPQGMRYRVEREDIANEVCYYMTFDNEGDAALFKLEYM